MKVAILDQRSDAVVGGCAGPHWSGTCPGVRANQPVFCAGRTIVAKLAGGREIRLEVEPDATICPLAAMNLGPRS